MKKSAVKEKTVEMCQDCNCNCGKKSGSVESPLYGIGLIGAAFYFLPGSNGISEWLWHIFQTITWPGFLVYHLLQFIGIGK
ncbi:MAG: hypothetical protein DPW11_00455 [bacterium]|nr:hypothetical protein [Candidatus Microgenomates bacterium CPR3]MCQ3944239.1 hypothetical protein [bacterium]RIK51760.1 MAG: hypothetical protein DCC61_01635 [Candidatus Microgenomates bacterium]